MPVVTQQQVQLFSKTLLAQFLGRIDRRLSSCVAEEDLLWIRGQVKILKLQQEPHMRPWSRSLDTQEKQAALESGAAEHGSLQHTLLGVTSRFEDHYSKRRVRCCEAAGRGETLFSPNPSMASMLVSEMHPEDSPRAHARDEHNQEDVRDAVVRTLSDEVN